MKLSTPTSHSKTRPLVLAGGLAVVLAGLATSVAAESLPMRWAPPSGMPPEPVAGSEAIIHKSAAGISAHVTSNGLTPGNAVTFWLVAVQNPDLCESNPCSPVEAMGEGMKMGTVAINGGGAVVGADGTILISSFMPTGSVKGNLFSTKLDKPETSEVHVVIHNHGPLIPGVEADMLGTYRGGCNDASIPPFYPPSAAMDGAPGPNKCHTAQVALFLPTGKPTN